MKFFNAALLLFAGAQAIKIMGTDGTTATGTAATGTGTAAASTAATETAPTIVGEPKTRTKGDLTITTTKFSDGAVVREITKAGVYLKTVTKLADGTMETNLPDGTFLQQRTDGTKLRINPDGSGVEISPDGTKNCFGPPDAASGTAASGTAASGTA